jgi:membrane protein implicated in regulation of membrane protease activity
MLVVYLAALVVALGIFGIQAFAGHDADASGHDLAHADHDAPPWALALSLRFWSFALLAFGLVGALLTFFGLAGAVFAAVLACVSGVASGAFAATVIRRMTHRGPSSQIAAGEVVGKLGRVLVPAAAGSRGKVRVQVRGQLVDYVASSREELGAGDSVVVEDYEGGEVVVSKAPKELSG